MELSYHQLLLLLFTSFIIGINCLDKYDEPCPRNAHVCNCEWIEGEYIYVDCSDKGLTDFPDFEHPSLIKVMDLSRNYLLRFPSNLSAYINLNTLDVSNNQISAIPKTALTGCSNLRFLHINKNNITYWADINPNHLLQPAASLHTLSLSGNPLTSFTSIDETFILISSTLKLLDLSDCRISKVPERHVLSGLLTLEHLILSGNPLREVSSLISKTLRTLDLSHCRLTELDPNIFLQLPALTIVTLSFNHRLSLRTDKDKFVMSDSLKCIYLSNCNMDYIELEGFPNLLTAILNNNLITELKRDAFENNSLLENLDLSFNSIQKISSTTFSELKQLKNLDLSYNMLRRIETDTFKNNDVLTNINLSRNFIERFNRFKATSLAYLNMSWCEVLYIDMDAFNDMPELNELDLSNNLLSDFPATLQSETLDTLNLGRCRLSSVQNATFRGFPKLSRLNLAGNRFTTTFRTDFFEKNEYLSDIWLGDNPWRCDCNSLGFLHFFNFITEQPGAKLQDRAHLRCISPDEVYGLTWDTACFSLWFPDSGRSMGTVEKVWTILMLIIIVLAGALCMSMAIKKCVQGRKMTEREEERIRNLEEARDLMRQNRMMMEQEAQLNAPDIRESRPPCYEDAILLPRLDGSFASLNELALKRAKRKSNRIKMYNANNRIISADDSAIGDDDDDDDDMETVNTSGIRRNRSRSEELLSMRDTVRQQDRTSRHERASRIVSARLSTLPAMEIPPRNTNLETTRNTSIGPTTTNDELHYHATDILSLNHHRRASQPIPPAVTPVVIINERNNNTNVNRLSTGSGISISITSSSNNSDVIAPVARSNTAPVHSSDSMEIIDNIKVFDNTGDSPYAQRRKHMVSFKEQGVPSSAASTSRGRPEIVMVEDYYGGNGKTVNNQRDQGSSSLSSDEFTTISPEEMKEIRHNR